MLLAFLNEARRNQTLEEAIMGLEKVSGYSIKTLTELFLKGYTLEPPRYPTLEEVAREMDDLAKEMYESM